MTKVKNLAGSPWHKEFLHMDEDDHKRDRRRCIYYVKDEKHCTYQNTVCFGATHCKNYKEYEKVTEVKSDSKPKEKSLNSKNKIFKGTEYILISEVIINRNFLPPNKSKVEQAIEYYRKNGELEKAIYVTLKNDKYVLEDKYLMYYVAKKLGLVSIRAKIGNFEQSKKESKLKKVGATINHKTYGKGVIVDADDENVRIEFESKITKIFDIKACVDNGMITVL